MTRREFETLFRRLYLPLGMYALRITGDTAEAEDVVQEAFVRAWQRIEEGDEIENFKPFMYMSVRNGCISLLRRRHETTGLETMPEPTEEAVDTSERDARVWRAIEALPERCREIFLMSKRDGLSNEDIASELGLSLQTVKNQITKALSRLRDELSEGGRPFFLPFL